MSDGTFAPATLWARMVEQTARARRCGKLQSLATEQVVVEQGGIRFVLRRLASLARKQNAAAEPANPFLPYDRDLFVADVSSGHVALLNKFNVMDHHLLIVTRDFVDQETL
nr:phosphorylase [Pseudomonadota bacterium]